jgi:hypothetical protein
MGSEKKTEKTSWEERTLEEPTRRKAGEGKEGDKQR